MPLTDKQRKWHFYPRSPCGERPIFAVRPYDAPIFLSTLSLRRATNIGSVGTVRRTISIHALLAESDRLNAAGAFSIKHFYPRSPCGERLGLLSPTDPRQTISIHALLAESDYCHAAGGGKDDDFYPRSPCGERLVQRGPGPHQGRHFYPRSPCGERQRQKLYAQRLFSYFYPRSPCGERPGFIMVDDPSIALISIHALLAESDYRQLSPLSRTQ